VIISIWIKTSKLQFLVRLYLLFSDEPFNYKIYVRLTPPSCHSSLCAAWKAPHVLSSLFATYQTVVNNSSLKMGLPKDSPCCFLFSKLVCLFLPCVP